jgi:hypothetical protein
MCHGTWMGKWCPKHVEDLRFNKVKVNVLSVSSWCVLLIIHTSYILCYSFSPSVCLALSFRSKPFLSMPVETQRTFTVFFAVSQNSFSYNYLTWCHDQNNRNNNKLAFIHNPIFYYSSLVLTYPSLLMSYSLSLEGLTAPSEQEGGALFLYKRKICIL